MPSDNVDTIGVGTTEAERSTVLSSAPDGQTTSRMDRDAGQGNSGASQVPPPVTTRIPDKGINLQDQSKDADVNKLRPEPTDAKGELWETIFAQYTAQAPNFPSLDVNKPEHGFITAELNTRNALKGTRWDHKMVQRANDVGACGISMYAYEYAAEKVNDPKHLTATPIVIYDIDNRWTMAQEDHIPGRATSLSEQVEQIMNWDGPAPPTAFNSYMRMRAPILHGAEWLEVLRIASPFFAHSPTTAGIPDAQEAIRGGYSAKSPMAHLLGYYGAMGFEPDAGLSPTTSMRANEQPKWYDAYLPAYAVNGVASLPKINAYYMATQFMSEILTPGSPGMERLGKTFADLDKTLVIIPVTNEQAAFTDAYIWYLIALLKYPFKEIYFSGKPYDWYGELVPPQPGKDKKTVDLTQKWWPGVMMLKADGACFTLTDVPGVDGGAASVKGEDDLVVIFLRTQEATRDRKLVFDGAAGGDPIVLQLGTTLVGEHPTTGVDIGPAINRIFTTPPQSSAPAILTALGILANYAQGSADIADSLAILASMSNFHLLGGEVSGKSDSGNGSPVMGGGFMVPKNCPSQWCHPSSRIVMAPASEAKGTLGRPWSTPTNAIGMYPAVTWDPATLQPITPPAAQLANFSVPPHDSFVAWCITAGIVTVRGTTVGQVHLPSSPRQLALYLAKSGLSMAAAFDMIMLLTAVPRSFFWLAGHANTERDRSFARIVREKVWGINGSTQSHAGRTVPGRVSQAICEGRILVRYPNNGFLATIATTSLPAVLSATGNLRVSRYPPDTIFRYYKDAIDWLGDRALRFCDMNWNGKVSVALSNNHPITRNGGYYVFAAGCEDDASTTIADFCSKVARFKPFHNLGVVTQSIDPSSWYGKVFLIYRDGTDSNAHPFRYVEGNAHSPLTWANLISIGDDSARKAYVEYVPQDVSMSLIYPPLDFSRTEAIFLRYAIHSRDPLRDIPLESQNLRYYYTEELEVRRLADIPTDSECFRAFDFEA